MATESITRDVDTFGPIFDADHHYWEPSDAFTRHRDPRFADRGIRLVDIDGRGRPSYLLDGGRVHPILPGPGDVYGRPRPGALYDYFAGKTSRESVAAFLSSEDPAEHPEWFQRDARLVSMDSQGVEAVWLFPSQGVCIEGPMQPDIEASVAILRAFNRWLDDDWGFAYQNRIFGIPYLSLSDLGQAIDELDWCLGRGARVISIRNGPAFTPEGMRSPADPMFDPFWARCRDAGVVVTAHAGFEDGYQHVDRAVAQAWGYGSTQRGTGRTNALTAFEPFVQALMKRRLVHDFAAALVCHGLFERHPGLRVAFVENGATWVGPLLHLLEVMHVQNPGMFTSSPVDQFIEHCWVAPFVEDDVAELARQIPVERILFGSDWPHAEGLAHPRDFFAKVDSFSLADQRKIMIENARQLTLG